MKLKRKIMILVLFVILAAFLAGGGYSVLRMNDSMLSMAAGSEREKLSVIGNAFRQVGTREDFDSMGEIARDAYLKYQFERCYEKGYALLKDGECIKNLTEYEVVNPGALKGEYIVQEISGKHLLLLRMPLEYPEGFEVLAVRDISFLHDEIQRQILALSAAFVLIAVLASVFAAIGAGRLLSGLADLETAAEAIGRGALGTVVEVRGKDEIGRVAEVFNKMSGQVAGQVEDLRLLLGALSHEMKTPVTSIIGYADTLLHVRLSKEQQERSLWNIYEAGMRMEKMSAKMLALLGMYENESIEMREIDCKTLMDRLVTETEAMRMQKQIGLFVSCEENLKIFGDEELLLSLFSNLIQNSVRASEDGSTVEILADRNGIQVTDHGCGMDKKDIPNVTKAFYMADKSRSRSAGGSGLGLALADRIVKLHGGEMRFESEPGVGTRVLVRFTKDLHVDEAFDTES